MKFVSALHIVPLVALAAAQSTTYPACANSLCTPGSIDYNYCVNVNGEFGVSTLSCMNQGAVNGIPIDQMDFWCCPTDMSDAGTSVTYGQCSLPCDGSNPTASPETAVDTFTDPSTTTTPVSGDYSPETAVDTFTDPSTVSGDYAVTIAGWDSSDCSGSPVLSNTFTGGPGVCQSYNYQGTTYYGIVYCDNGSPSGQFCTDSTCASCSGNLADAGNGVCGYGYGITNSAIAACGTSIPTSPAAQVSGSVAAEQQPLSNGAEASGLPASSSDRVVVVGIAAAAAACLAAVL